MQRGKSELESKIVLKRRQQCKFYLSRKCKLYLCALNAHNKIKFGQIKYINFFSVIIDFKRNI